MRCPLWSVGFGRVVSRLSLGALLLALAIVNGGCEGLTFESFNPNKGFIDPSEVSVTTPSKGPLLVPILEKVAPDYEESDEAFTQATDVRPDDLIIPPGDYPIGISDLLQISITDLVSPGVETIKQARVSETGKISLPLIGQIQAAGLTESQLEQAISAAYRDQQIIQNAQVSVQVQIAQSRTFSILGAVQRPGQYAIPRSDFRILDALVAAGDLTVDTDIRGTRGIENFFVLRREAPTAGGGSQPATTPQSKGGTAPANPSDLLAPPSRPSEAPTTQPSAAANEPTTAPSTPPADEAEGRYIIGPDGKPTYVGGREPAAPNGEHPAPAPNANAPFIPNPQLEGTERGQALAPGSATSFVFNDMKNLDTRIIRIPVAALRQGDLRYNIIIHPDDMIVVRPPTIGEYYMGGHVARVGVYSLTARKITLTQAVISAGMLDQLAVPGRCQVIRRIGSDHQCFARVDLEKIFAGEQPDIYLKPDDQVLVGTNASAPFLAAIRGGFRFTYGFGFLYDRNYAYDNNLQGR